MKKVFKMLFAQKKDFSPGKYIGVLLLIILVFLGIRETTEFSINRSESLPQKVFLIVKKLPFKKGDLIAVKGHQTKYYPRITFIKRVVGFPGDKITYQGNHFFINRMHQGELLKETSFGEPLAPLKYKIIPQGYFFIKGDHKRSFDSRYQEFGLVREEHLIGRAFGIW